MKKMWRWMALVALVGLLAACGQPGAFVLPEQEGALQTAGNVEQVFPLNPVVVDVPDGMVDETPTAWFIQFATAPRVKGGAANAQANERALFRSTALAERIQFQERYDFRTLFNGLSVDASPAQIAKLARLPGVTAVFPVVLVEIPATASGSSPDLATAIAMTGASYAQSEMGLSGEGVRVAVMDTGIDYEHPDLGFGWGNRVVAGWDFVGDDFDASVPGSIAVPDEDPMDCNGHGTHVAGIVGAKAAGTDGVTGVAPGVEFGAYKVFGCAGSTTADIMIAAMEMALADDMHVLNMSIGAAFQWPQYPTAVAASNLVDAGMIVVASIGNSGASGVYSAGAPGLGEHVIGVASFDNSHINALTFNVNPGGQQVPYLTLSTAEDPPTEGDSAGIVYVGRGCTITMNDELLADPTGKVALLVRGACTFDEKYQGAVDAGAVGVIIHNNVTGLFAGGGVVSRDVFGIGISLADGSHIRSLLDAGVNGVTATWTDVRFDAPNPTGNLISSFSSYGLSPDLALKPDIGAPGGLIRSTYPLALGGYATVSGTSMSAPHVAGGVALLLHAHPDVRPHDVRGILQNSAKPKNWWGNPGLGFLDNVHRQGAGMLDIPGAILATTRITPAKVALGESEAGPHTETLWIENRGSDSVTYIFSHTPALSTGGSTFSPSFFTGFASVDFSAASVTVPAGGSASVQVTISANPALADRSQYGGYIVVTPEGGVAPYRVPYAGFKGDYQSIGVLTPTQFGFPWLAKLDGPSYLNQPDGATFTMQGDDIPFFLIHLDHQSRYMEMNILQASNKRPVHPNFHKTNVFDYLPRNGTATGFFVFAWDGSRYHSEMVRGKGPNELFKVVPNGAYLIELKVLKALGNPSNPAHWESWTSPVITIARPVQAPPTPVSPPGRR